MIQRYKYRYADTFKEIFYEVTFVSIPIQIKFASLDEFCIHNHNVSNG